MTSSQLADRLAALGIALDRDGASVHHAQVRTLALCRFAKARPLERLAHELRFVLIDFATERHRPQRCQARVKCLSLARHLLFCVLLPWAWGILSAVSYLSHRLRRNGGHRWQD